MGFHAPEASGVPREAVDAAEISRATKSSVVSTVDRLKLIADKDRQEVTIDDEARNAIGTGEGDELPSLSDETRGNLMSNLELTTHVETLGRTTRDLLERVERLERLEIRVAGLEDHLDDAGRGRRVAAETRVTLPSGGEVDTRDWTPGDARSFPDGEFPEPEVPITLEETRRTLEEHDRAITRLIWKTAQLVEDTEELNVARTAHADEESIQILDLRRRLDDLETKPTGPSERIADLERSLGMAAAENRRLEGRCETLDKLADDLRRRLAKAEKELETAREAAKDAGDEVHAARGIRDGDARRIVELEAERDMHADLARCTIDFLIQCDLKPAGERDDGELRRALERANDLGGVRKWAVIRYHLREGAVERPDVTYFDARGDADAAFESASEGGKRVQLVAIVKQGSRGIPE